MLQKLARRASLLPTAVRPLLAFPLGTGAALRQRVSVGLFTPRRKAQAANVSQEYSSLEVMQRLCVMREQW